jgi:hypothetical protein
MTTTTPAPAPARKLTIAELLQLEQFSAQGLGPNEIAILLGMTPQQFMASAEADEAIYKSLLFGRTNGIARVSRALFNAATSGNDTGAARFYLERLGDAVWRAPKQNSPVVVIGASTVQIDTGVLAQRFERQRALQDAFIEGRIDEVPDNDPAKEKPSQDGPERV